MNKTPTLGPASGSAGWLFSNRSLRLLVLILLTLIGISLLSRLPAWPPYRREDRMTMRFDSTIGPVSDLAGLQWRQPWNR